MKKRWIAIMLAGVLAASLSACGAQQEASQGAASTQQGTSEEKGGSQGTSEGKGSQGTSEENGGTQQGPAEAEFANAVLAEYPGEEISMSSQEFSESELYSEWWESYWPLVDASVAAQDGMDDYYTALIGEMLQDTDENSVCSPINIYIALAMLSEMTDGNTRAQILDVLQADDIEELRTRVKALWEANYVATPVLTSLLADSIWLRDDFDYSSDTLRSLAENYYASSFRGEMGSGELDQALQEWTDRNTGGLLSEYTKNLRLDPSTVIALVSAIYYKAAWFDEFQKDATDTGVFHGAQGDQDADMMHKSDLMTYYTGDGFTAIRLSLSDSGYMYFFRPDDETSAYEVMTDGQMLDLVRKQEAKDSFTATVNMTIPKFSIQQKTDLLAVMEKLGMTDVLSAGIADFSPLAENGQADGLSVTQAEHAAIVDVNEDGVTGAAYTMMMVTEGAFAGEPEEVDFILDKPFGFAVTGTDGSVLFTGIVQSL